MGIILENHIEEESVMQMLLGYAIIYILCRLFYHGVIEDYAAEVRRDRW